MKINTKNLNPPIWFNFPNTDASVCLRICAGDDLDEINSKTIRKEIEYKDGNRYEYRIVDEKLRNELFWDFCIVDWKNINDENDSPVPCTRENKVLFIGKMPKFTSFVADCLERVGQIIMEQRELEEKNSLTSLGGSSKE